MVKRQQKQFVKFAEQQCSRLVETKNFQQVVRTLRKHYKLVPLEVFGNNPYKTLVSTLLSSRTKDETTLEASNRLFFKAPNLTRLTLLKENEIAKLIYPVGFYKTKAKHLYKLVRLISRVPKTRAELIKLPGVGTKTANLVLNRAFGIPAIAVDTHVHRITNLLGWVNTKTPEETEKELVKILPKKYWPNTNRYFVSIGRQFRSTEKLKIFLKQNNLL